MIDLRPYQREALAGVRAAYRAGHRRVLMTSPTGSGKTTVAAAMIHGAVTNGRHVIFAASLRELLTDTGARLAAAGVDFGFVQAGRPTNPRAPVQLVGLQTAIERGARPPCDVLFIDEAHHAPAASIRGVLESYPDAYFCGLSATPVRADGQALDVFQALVQGPSVRTLIAGGFLVRVEVIAPGTYQERGLSMDPVAAYQAYGDGRRALIFATNTAHAEDVTTRLLAAGHRAELVTGETKDAVRAGLRARVTSGATTVVVNVAVAVEGLDVPAIEVVILARAFTSVGPYLQAIGRAMRPSPTTLKTRCTVLDLRGAVNLHGLPDEDRAWSLEGTAVRRLESMTALQRCKECLAISRPAVACPRCGARAEALVRLPRVLSRAERLERVSDLPQWQRDERYIAVLERIGRERRRMPRHRAEAWAIGLFKKKFKREPSRRAA